MTTEIHANYTCTQCSKFFRDHPKNTLLRNLRCQDCFDKNSLNPLLSVQVAGVKLNANDQVILDRIIDLLNKNPDCFLIDALFPGTLSRVDGKVVGWVGGVHPADLDLEALEWAIKFMTEPLKNPLCLACGLRSNCDTNWYKSGLCLGCLEKSRGPKCSKCFNSPLYCVCKGDPSHGSTQSEFRKTGN